MKGKDSSSKLEDEFIPKKIVVAFDASLHSIKALKAAISISEKYRSEITVIHCIEYPVVGYGEVYYNWDEFYSADKRNVTKASEPLIKEARKQKVKIGIVYTEGTASVA